VIPALSQDISTDKYIKVVIDEPGIRYISADVLNNLLADVEYQEQPSHFDIPGVGGPCGRVVKKDSVIQCGTVTRWVSCPGGHVRHPLKSVCENIDCEDGHTKWMGKASHRISERLRGVREYLLSSDHALTAAGADLRARSNLLRHVVVSPPEGLLLPDISLEDAFKAFKKIRERFALWDGGYGMVVFHPYRLRDELKDRLKLILGNRASQPEHYSKGGLWELIRQDPLHLGSWYQYVVWSPHFHVIGAGRPLVKSTVFASQSGWIYKNLGARKLEITINPKSGIIEDQLTLGIRYLLSHAAVERAEWKFKNTYRFFGYASGKRSRLKKNRDGKVMYELIESDLRCPECGDLLQWAEEIVHLGLDENGRSFISSTEYILSGEVVKSRRKYRLYEVSL